MHLWLALATAFLLKQPCHTQNASTASEAICQRALRSLFTALRPEPATHEMAGKFQKSMHVAAVSMIYVFFGDQEEGVEENGTPVHIESPTQAIKRSYGMNTTLIQSRLLILDHLLAECISSMEEEVMARHGWWLSWIKTARQDKNRTGAQRDRVNKNKMEVRGVKTEWTASVAPPTAEERCR